MSANKQRKLSTFAMAWRVTAGFMAVILVAVALIMWPRAQMRSITVDFDRTVSLFVGSNVRVLGVTVGRVDSIQPRGTKVRVRISWDAEVKIPADVQAVIVSPSVVGDRFVQLTPAYTDGPEIRNGTHLDQARSVIPTELDETYAAISRFTAALGPEGANADGALSRFLSSSADNLDGQGQKLRDTIAALGELTRTFDGSKEEFFGGIEQIQLFVAALEENDAAVRNFNTSLAQISTTLAGERDNLAAMLQTLAETLGDLRAYVKENRGSLKRSVKGLARVTKVLADQQKDVDELLRLGPAAITNLAAAYNPVNGTIDARSTVVGNSGKLNVLADSVTLRAFCGVVVKQDPSYRELCYDVGKVVDVLARNRPGGDADPEPAARQDSLASLMGAER